MKLLKLMHANAKAEVFVSEDQIFGVYYSANAKATHLIGPGGACIPVVESVETVNQMRVNLKESKE